MDELATLRQPPALPAILVRTTAPGFPMPSEPRTGALLRALCAGKPGGNLLELGMGTGLATAWTLDGRTLPVVGASQSCTLLTLTEAESYRLGVRG